MTISDSILASMRATNEIFCLTVIGLRNVEALDSVYTPDAQILPPGVDLIQGLPAIKSFWSEAIEGLDIKSASLTTVSAESAGDAVVEIGRAQLTLAGGQVVPVKYVVHWKLDGSDWKWHTDIWNMNQ